MWQLIFFSIRLLSSCTCDHIVTLNFCQKFFSSAYHGVVWRKKFVSCLMAVLLIVRSPKLLATCRYCVLVCTTGWLICQFPRRLKTVSCAQKRHDTFIRISVTHVLRAIYDRRWRLRIICVHLPPPRRLCFHLCLSVCLFVCLFVNRITHKMIKRSERRKHCALPMRGPSSIYQIWNGLLNSFKGY